jgi:hypothetical protein
MPEIKIRTHFSDIFDVSEKDIQDYGAFNISLINDLPLFIDPFLLFNSENPEYQKLHQHMLSYLGFLREMASSGALRPGLLRAWYVFPEIRQNWLGFSLVGNHGSGLGLDFAAALHENLGAVLNSFGAEEITRSSHLEKVCLIKDGVGKDNISDFTTNLIKGFLLEYTQEFAARHLQPTQRRRVHVDRAEFNYETRSWLARHFDLPVYEGDFVLLTPKDILTKDETWINKADMFGQFDDVLGAMPDAVLRAQLNDYFLQSLPEKPKPKDVKEAKAATIRKYPLYVDHFIRMKEDQGDDAAELSGERVASVESTFVRQVKEFVYLVADQTPFYATGYTTYEEARRRVLFLKDVIENKGGHRLFLDVRGAPIRRESDLQILYRLCWFATTSDVSRETNDGRGPVDFKISRGAADKVLIEFKLASNTKLARNLEKQVEIYKKASDARRAIKVILAFSDVELKRVAAILAELGLDGNQDVIVIDGDPNSKPSGSKA